jgi:hypothetical protein
VDDFINLIIVVVASLIAGIIFVIGRITYQKANNFLVARAVYGYVDGLQIHLYFSFADASISPQNWRLHCGRLSDVSAGDQLRRHPERHH